MSNKAIEEWFPLYAGDWMTSMGLRLCSPFSRGILIDLMAYSWQTETPGIVKDNHEDLSLFFHCSVEEFKTAITELEKRKCIIRNNGDIKIKRLMNIAEEQDSKHKKRVEDGKKGGLKKAENKERENKE
jgi:hypothetical protein